MKQRLKKSYCECEKSQMKVTRMSNLTVGRINGWKAEHAQKFRGSQATSLKSKSIGLLRINPGSY